MIPSSPHRPYRYLISFSGELSIKGKGTRQRFVDRLVSNLAEAVRSHGMPCDIERSWSRLLLHAPDPRAAEIAGRVFGVHSVAPVEQRSWKTMDDILHQGVEVLASHVQGKTFAVKARRGEASQNLPFKSPDIERRLGALLHPFAQGVDLKNPEAAVTVELRGQEVFYGGARQRVHGGLPIGTEGKALALMSGGFDSAVAAWKILRRGVQLDYVFLNLGGDAHRDNVLRVLKVITDRWSYGYRPRLHIIDFRPRVDEIQRHCPPSLWQVVLKRQMLRSAEQVARMQGLAALVTGEVVGQVSSQTLQNLAVISAVTPLPILRPLVTEAKEDIVAWARRIGTYEASAQVPEYCALDGKRPETHAKPSAVAKAEERLDLEALQRAVEDRTRLDMRALDLDLEMSPSRAIDHIPAAAEVIDLRRIHAYRSWHVPGARQMGYHDALQNLSRFTPDQRYVFYCEIGLKSAHVAELLGRRGVDACHIDGGLKTVMGLVDEGDAALQALRSPALLD